MTKLRKIVTGSTLIHESLLIRSKLEELLDSSEKIVNESKRQTMELAKEFGKTTAKLSSLEKSYDTLKFKHRHCSKHLKRYKKELLDSNDEKKVLQSQLQEYVNKVRIIEDMLLQKEQEREFVFEQFKGMSEKNVCKDIGTSVGTNASPESNYEEDLSNETVSKEVNCLPYSVYDLKLNGLHQELMTERRTSKHLHDVIKTTREEAMMTNRENEELTKQLSAMRMSVQNLEDKIKTIAESLDTYHGEPCHETNENDVSKVRIYCTGEKSESSHSTML